MEGINLEEVAKKYNKVNLIWDEKDKWHFHSHIQIKRFITDSLAFIPEHNDLKLLNAGSGGYSYGIKEENVIHVDIAKDKISHLPNFIVSSIEHIPIPDHQFDLIICVGSVINYCDPIKVFEEFKRILKPRGNIILEFENSHTFEFLGKKGFNKKAVLIDTYYNGSQERIWYFSESYIKALINSFDFKIVLSRRFHILSALIYRFYQDANFAASFGKTDGICGHIPFLNKYCSNSIFLLKQDF